MSEWVRRLALWSWAAAAAVLVPASGRAAEIDLTKAVVVAPAGLTKAERKAVAMLVDEVRKRTLVRWDVRAESPADGTPVVAVWTARALPKGAVKPQPAGEAKEGYRLFTEL